MGLFRRKKQIVAAPCLPPPPPNISSEWREKFEAQNQEFLDLYRKWSKNG